MRQGAPKIAAVGRSLAMLEAVLSDREGQNVEALGKQLGIPRATAHRQVRALLEEGFLARLGGGQFAAGPRLRRLVQLVDEKQTITVVAAPVLHRLAARARSVVQLGTLENDMVTYRLKTGEGAGDLFTKIGLQLEAYCTGVGKALLAHLPRAEREAYLATGPFPQLTANTITSSDGLRQELEDIASRGFAIDNEEIVPGLSCLAAPIRGPDHSVSAAISVSRLVSGKSMQQDLALLGMLQEAAREIETSLAALS